MARRDPGPRAPRRRARLGAADVRDRPGGGDRARRAVLRHDPLPAQDPRLDRRGVRRGHRTGCVARGWLDADGAFTELGRDERQRIEDETDRLALEGWAHVGVERTARLHELVKPLRERITAAGVLPGAIRP